MKMYVRKPTAGQMKVLLAMLKVGFFKDHGFPWLGEPGQHELILIESDGSAKAEESALAQMEEQGLVPAEVEYLIAYSEQNLGQLGVRSVVSLGTGWVNPKGVKFVAYLFENEVQGRGVSLRGRYSDQNPKGHWPKGAYFLARRA